MKQNIERHFLRPFIYRLRDRLACKNYIFGWMSAAIDKLFDYDNFRTFLKDYFEEQKRMRAVFSHRFFAAKAGFSSSSYCLNVIRGRFNLTPKSIEKMAKAMDLDNRQRAYFAALVEYNQAKRPEERDAAWNQVVQIRTQNEFVHLSKDQKDYFSKWYYPVLRELAVHPDWDGDITHLARLSDPAISTEEARIGLANLENWGLIAKGEDGKYHRTSLMLDASGVSPMDLRQIRREYIQHGIGAVESKKPFERFATFTTLAMSASSYDYAVRVLEEARQKIIARASDDNVVDKVYEMMILTYPMSRSVKKEGSK